MDDIRDRLLRRAYLYVDTEAYTAGVDAALSAVAGASAEGEGDEDRGDAALLTMHR